MVRAYEEYLKHPSDVFYVKAVVHQMNVMAERMWSALDDIEREEYGRLTTASEFRRYLVERHCRDFQLVWDVDDAHKHVELSRKSAVISSADQSGTVTWGGAIGSAPLGAAPIAGTVEEFIFKTNDGSEVKARIVLHNVMEMWKSMLG